LQSFFFCGNSRTQPKCKIDADVFVPEFSQKIAFISRPVPSSTVISTQPVGRHLYPAADLITGPGPNGEGSMHVVANAVSASNAFPLDVQMSNPLGVQKQKNAEHAYTVYVPRFCSSSASSPLCSCTLAGMATSQRCSPGQPIAVRNNVAHGEWLTSSSFTKKDGSTWSSYYKLSKDDGAWKWESKSNGEFLLGKSKAKGKAPKQASNGPLTKCPSGTYMGVSGNCISKTKCADGTYCSKGRIGSPAPEA